MQQRYHMEALRVLQARHEGLPFFGYASIFCIVRAAFIKNQVAEMKSYNLNMFYVK